MGNRTLYLSDLDGTLLDGSARLSAATTQTLNRLIDSGMLFTYATARSFSSASRVTEGLRLRLPLSTYNGAFFHLPVDGRIVDKYVIEPNLVRPLIEAVLSTSVPPLVYSLIDGKERVSWLSGRESPGIHNYLAARKGDERLRRVQSFPELFGGEVFYITMIGEEGDAPAFQQVVKSFDALCCNLQRDTYDKNEYWLEMYSKKASKRNAVIWLKEYAKADRIVCFGDNLNDIPMFQSSDECYTVSNAHPALKELADATIGSNVEDDVARWLEEHYIAQHDSVE